ncbi:MAG: FG-GAP-like repeat-containing protein [Fuerstiella sp.]
MLVVFLASIAIFVCISVWTVDVDQLLIEARKALHHQQNVRAGELANKILRHQPNHADARMIAAIAASEQGNYEEAVRHCAGVSEDAGPVFVDAQCMAGNLALNYLGDLSSAEAFYARANLADPNNLVALDRLSYLLALQTRTRELVPRQLVLIRKQVISSNRLLSLAHSDLLFPDVDLLRTLRTQEPEHPGLMLGDARLAEVRKDFTAAKKLVGAAVRFDPKLNEAHARLGQILLHVGSVEELQRWQQQLPPSAMQHPLTWITLGQLAERFDNPTGAARCFREAGLRDAASLPANYMLGRQLSSLGRPEDAGPFLQRARALEKYRRIFDSGSVSDSSRQFTAELLQKAQTAAESLGLIWEAYGFSWLAGRTPPTPLWAEEALGRLQPQLSNLPLTRTAPQFNMFRRVDLSNYELSIEDIIPGIESTSIGRNQSAGEVHFENIAKRVGIEFPYDNGVDSSISGAQRPYDFTGGGIAAFDADGDSWPDLYFSQGCVLEDQTGKPLRGRADQIFRNQQGNRFTDVSRVSLPQDLDYSQGVATGDFNNDGFTDLFIGNLGPNRLMRNNGDGTFSEVSSSIDNNAAQWTTSCLICDLNGDDWPDLYSVNYLSGDILSRVCRDETGRRNSCAPQSFPSAQDRIHLSDGSGKFVDVTDSSGIRRSNGKGLGIVVADVNQDRKLDLFIANDGVPNFLFENAGDSGRIAFREVATERGVAVNNEGLSEACMGGVIEDLDLDFHPELLVTNFLDETNTLYTGAGPNGFFRDVTWTSGLGSPSLPVLGFGIQVLDGELDGLPDLVVANGHVDDFTDRGVPYRMMPQYFRNLGGLRFALQGPKSIGEYFSLTDLGRCVTRLDWDRDGAEDIVIGTLDGGTSLLHNRTLSRGSSVTVRLRSVTSQRDAFGAIVSVTTNDRSVTRQLAAGDGYQASNERILVFGLGDASQKTQIAITWINGLRQNFAEVDFDHEYTAVEGRAGLYMLPK